MTFSHHLQLSCHNTGLVVPSIRLHRLKAPNSKTKKAKKLRELSAWQEKPVWQFLVHQSGSESGLWSLTQAKQPYDTSALFDTLKQQLRSVLWFWLENDWLAENITPGSLKISWGTLRYNQLCGKSMRCWLLHAKQKLWPIKTLWLTELINFYCKKCLM